MIDEAKPETLAGPAAKALAAKIEARNIYPDAREEPERTRATGWARELAQNLRSRDFATSMTQTNRRLCFFFLRERALPSLLNNALSR